MMLNNAPMLAGRQSQKNIGEKGSLRFQGKGLATKLVVFS